MLLSRAQYTVLWHARWDRFEMKWDAARKLVRQKQLGKVLILVLPVLSVSDYKRVYTSLYFIITNFHMEHKPQIMVSHGMNSTAFTLHTMLINHGQLVNHTALIRFD